MKTKAAPRDALLADIQDILKWRTVPQADIVRATGIDKNTVSVYFAGKRGISTRKATAILDYLKTVK